MKREREGLDLATEVLALPHTLRTKMSELQVLDRRYQAAVAKLVMLTEHAVNSATTLTASEQQSLANIIAKLETEIVRLCDEKVQITESGLRAAERSFPLT